MALLAFGLWPASDIIIAAVSCPPGCNFTRVREHVIKNEI